MNDEALVGLNWHQAAAQGYDVRPVIINGIGVFCTQEYNPNRINVEIDLQGTILKVVARG